jgi:ribosomal 50S subunit-associated protein YjgA (DUF615 family)
MTKQDLQNAIQFLEKMVIGVADQDRFFATLEALKTELVSELSAALELVTEDRDNLRDAGNSLMHELEACRTTLVQAHSDISRLRVWLAQGAEL